MKAKVFMSIAAIATFVALTAPVHASIKYTPVNIVVPNNGAYGIDFNHDGIKDFWIGSFFTKNEFCGNRGAPGGAANLTPAQSKGGVILKGGYAAALPSGVSVGSSQSFAQRQTNLMFFNYCGGSLHSAGNWFNVSNHYLGMEFPINGQTYYGWAELSINGGRGGLTTALIGFAYETIPGKAIKTGQTKYAADDPDIGPDSADPGDPGPTATAVPPVSDAPRPQSPGDTPARRRPLAWQSKTTRNTNTSLISTILLTWIGWAGRTVPLYSGGATTCLSPRSGERR